jgi:hypothetical protein
VPPHAHPSVPVGMANRAVLISKERGRCNTNGPPSKSVSKILEACSLKGNTRFDD